MVTGGLSDMYDVHAEARFAADDNRAVSLYKGETGGRQALPTSDFITQVRGGGTVSERKIRHAYLAFDCGLGLSVYCSSGRDCGRPCWCMGSSR